MRQSKRTPVEVKVEGEQLHLSVGYLFTRFQGMKKATSRNVVE